MKTVYLDDSKIEYNLAQKYFEDAANWAKSQCPSFIDYHVQDVSDFSHSVDNIAEYRFNDPKDAVWFELKWNSH